MSKYSVFRAYALCNQAEEEAKQKTKKKVRKAVIEEREACAKLVEETMGEKCIKLAAAIRARSSNA